eukprot:GEZU01007253.1.p1 GENE.GEZU01007253.1~~GEZU01007253.1.p1  ORF type:complete len:1060 (-),score=283.26 GEZU01007253.1:92-3271(-)
MSNQRPSPYMLYPEANSFVTQQSQQDGQQQYGYPGSAYQQPQQIPPFQPQQSGQQSIPPPMFGGPTMNGPAGAPIAGPRVFAPPPMKSAGPPPPASAVYNHSGTPPPLPQQQGQQTPPPPMMQHRYPLPPGGLQPGVPSAFPSQQSPSPYSIPPPMSSSMIPPPSSVARPPPSAQEVQQNQQQQRPTGYPSTLPTNPVRDNYSVEDQFGAQQGYYYDQATTAPRTMPPQTAGAGFAQPPPPPASMLGKGFMQQTVDGFNTLSLGQQNQFQQQPTPSAALPRPTSDVLNELILPDQPNVSSLFASPSNPQQLAVNIDVSKVQASSRFIRMTCQSIPNSPTLLSKWGGPLGAVIHPFADLPPGEEIPVVNFGSAGVVRCRRCRSYINPFAVFIEGGRRWQCNMCNFINDVPADYFCPLDSTTGRRRDLVNRPELIYGSCEFVAPDEYCVRPPQPPAYLFVIDVSYNAVNTGMMKVVAETIRSTLDELPGDDRTQIGFITFDSTVHYYNLKSTLSQPQMLVVSDLEDVLLPLPSDLLVNLNESRTVVDALLTRLENGMFATTANVEVAFGAAMDAALKVLGPVGGKVLTFISGLPSIGPGRLRSRDDVRAYNTEAEKNLLGTADMTYKELALKFSNVHIAVDLFTTSSQFVDLATIGALPKLTGGQIFYYHGFRAEKHGRKLSADLRRALTRYTGFEAIMRIRTSNGLKISNFYGHFFVRGRDLLALPNVDADKAYGIQIAHTGNILSTPTAALQAAVLYTTSSGERRIRVHTITLPVTGSLADLFKYSDAEPTVNIMAKAAIDRALSNGMPSARDYVINECVQMFRSYRNSVAGQQRAAPSQLVLPDAFRYLPLFVLGLLKSPVLNSITHADERAVAFQRATILPSTKAILMFHPRMFAIHNLLETTAGKQQEQEQQQQQDQQVQVDLFPSTLVPLSMDSLSPTGAYLLDDSSSIWLWVGKDADQSLLNDVLSAADEANASSPMEGAAPVSPTTPLKDKILELVNNIRRLSPQEYLEVRFVRQESPLEAVFANAMIEDRGMKTHNYPEFLTHIHNMINKAM